MNSKVTGEGDEVPKNSSQFSAINSDFWGFLLLVASHGLQNPWCNESSGGIPWCNESSGVIFANPLDAILNQLLSLQQNKSGNVRHL